MRRPPRRPLFPYTTLFRSRRRAVSQARAPPPRRPRQSVQVCRVLRERRGQPLSRGLRGQAPGRRRSHDRPRHLRWLMSRPSRPPHVHKFGGASLASAPAIAHAVSIVQAQGRVPMVVVVSALAGVTDALLEIAARVARGERAALRGPAQALRRRHAQIARALFRAGARRNDMIALVDQSFGELDQLVAATGILREITPRTLDYIV